MACTLVIPPQERSLTRNPIWAVFESDLFTGSGPYTPSQVNLSAHVEVWRDTPGGEEKLAPLQSPYRNSDKRTEFNIATLFPRKLVLPTAVSIGIAPGSAVHYGEAVGLVDVYRLKYADQYGDPVTPEALTTSDDFICIHGGLPKDAIQNINWLGAIIPLHSYYYKRSDSYVFYKPVAAHQPDWIYFVALVTDNIIVKVTIQYTDGTNDVFDSHTIAVTANKAYWTQAGHDHLHIPDHADPDKEVAGYQVSFIRESTEQNAYTAFFVLDYVCPSWERFMLYHNGFGGYESVRLKGKTRYSHTVTRELFERTEWIDFSIQDGSIEQIRVFGNRIFNTHVGHYPWYYLEHLRQLLHAYLWLIDLDLKALDNYRFLRILAETNSIDLRDDEPGPDGFPITWKPAWQDDGHNVY